ncbi:MAG TPA: divergent polysaccharide deacetylase family protein [Elusimicrobiota bacterium]|jgi:polysaccharide deacetylase 2 family uncharacterized protein YibQ|nr:divergent polysaccharide deacetylase family protein [Elusimicrobiota bacterium]
MKATSVLAFLLIGGAARAQQPAAKPRIAVVIDDFGLTYKKNVPDEKWWAIPWPYTAAVMPESPRTKAAGEAAKKAGKEVLIHFPFDPFQKLDLDPNAATEADKKSVLKLLDKASKDIPQAVGLNNHRSLRGTQNQPLMRWFMPELKKRGLFFVDSWVSPKSVAFQEARAAGIPTARNDLFLEDGKKHDKATCEHLLRAISKRARKNGSAVAIGHHYWQGTYDCLTELVPRLQSEGFEFVSVSALTR